MTAPLFYTAFHLNLAFSSIAETERGRVVSQCYWPLLRLAEAGFRIGIEATSYTLRAIEAVDPYWTERLRDLVSEGRVEFIASGYSQMIAPLVPPEVTRWNLRLGLQDYDAMLGIRPRVALINEQAFSAGLVPIYLEFGFEAIIMDWAEPASHNRAWRDDLRGRPQRVKGTNGTEIPVIWSDAISFQKFQRYVHGEIEPQEYLEYLSLQLGEGIQALSLYTSDAEIFDFRPGRFETEAALGRTMEYTRIELLLQALSKSGEVRLGTPSEALEFLDDSVGAISLGSAAVPVPVKKQRKYNILRWAVTGRDDLTLNTYCWRLFEALSAREDASEDDWRVLCGLWASDYRTHIGEDRWRKLLAAAPKVAAAQYAVAAGSAWPGVSLPEGVTVEQEARYLTIDTPTHHLVLNCYRGLAIQSFGFGAAEPPYAGAPAENGLIGTLAHGFYRDIAFGADFYSGHMVLETNNSHKVTDLKQCLPSVAWCEDEQALTVSATVENHGVEFNKTLHFHVPTGDLETRYETNLPTPPEGSLRFAHVKLNPRAFDRRSLYYACHNGGDTIERFALYEDGLKTVDHGHAVSRLVSAQTGLGMTGGVLEIGDDSHAVVIEVKRTDAAGIGMVSCQPVGDSLFVRGAVSLREMDETATRPPLEAADKLGQPVYTYSIRLVRQSNRL